MLPCPPAPWAPAPQDVAFPRPLPQHFLGLSFCIREVSTYLLGLWLRSNEAPTQNPSNRARHGCCTSLLGLP